MTPDERDLLSRFLDDLSRSRPQAKDAEAAAQIDGSLRANPDAAYVLVQHAILADHALQDAQARIAELEQQAQAAAQDSSSPGGFTQGGAPAPQQSFLGSLFGKGAPPNPPGVGQAGPWGSRGGSAVPPTAPPAGYGYEPQPGYRPPQGSGPFSGGGGLGTFLRGAGTTAAGVAGGAFLFEGLSGLFGHHGGGLGLGGGGFGGGYGAPQETIINEYGGGDRDFADTSGSGPDYDSDNGDLSGDDYS